MKLIQHSAVKIKNQFIHTGLLFAFLPWPDFWITNMNKVQDGAVLRATFEKQCLGKGPIYSLVVARTDATRAKGLSRRPQPLAPTEGMIFIFDLPQRASFWMKDTLIPLQLVYATSAGEVIQVYEMPVEKNPQQPKEYYRSKTAIMTAIELRPRSINHRTTGLKLCIESN
jgi:uncharacterized membrane protein (UPF0127 family)